MTKMCEKVQRLHEELLSDIKLNELNISDKTKECPALKAKWLMVHLRERKSLRSLEESVGAFTEEYVKNFGKEGVPKIKTRMEAESSEGIKRIRKAMEDQKEVVEYMDGVMKIMYSFGFEIKNVISLLQLER